MSTLEQPGRTSGFHPAHVGHLVMGLAFLGLVAIWAVIQTGTVADSDVRWLLPLPWVFAGGAGLIAAVFSGRRGARAEQQAAYAGSAERLDRHDETDDLDLDQEEER